MKLINKSKLPIKIKNALVHPNDFIVIDDKVWEQEFDSNKIIREAVNKGMIEATIENNITGDK